MKSAGWNLIKADSTPSIAEHSYRNALIALILAKLEKCKNPEKIALAALMHKMHKIRLCDRHKVSAQYMDYPRKVKVEINKDQLSLLGDDLKREFEDILDLSDDEKVVVKDADQLELALEAKEYMDKGYDKAKIWIERIEQILITNSAKELFNKIKKTHSCDWWANLKKKPQTDKKEYISRI